MIRDLIYAFLGFIGVFLIILQIYFIGKIFQGIKFMINYFKDKRKLLDIELHEKENQFKKE